MKELIFICNNSASLGYVVFKQNWSLEQAEVSNRMSGQIYAVRQPMDKKWNWKTCRQASPRLN